MGLSNLVAPIASAHWEHRQLGEDDGSTDSSADFLAALHAEIDTAIVVSNSDQYLYA